MSFLTKEEIDIIVEAKTNGIDTEKFPRLKDLGDKRLSATEVGKTKGYDGGIFHSDDPRFFEFAPPYIVDRKEYILAPGADHSGSEKRWKKRFGNDVIKKKCSFCSTITYLPATKKDSNTICWNSKETDKCPPISIIDKNLEFKEKIVGKVDITNSGYLRITAVTPILEYYDANEGDLVHYYGLENPGGLLHGALLSEIIIQNTDIEEVFTSMIDGPIIDIMQSKNKGQQPEEEKEEKGQQPEEEKEEKGQQPEEEKYDFEIIQLMRKEISENESDEIKTRIKQHIIKDIKSITKSYEDKVKAELLAEKETEEKLKAKKIFDEEQKAKEQERKSKIDTQLKNLYGDTKLVFKATNVIFEGPPRTGKTYNAKKCAVELEEIFVDTKTNDKYKEFENKGYIQIVTFNSAYDSNKTIEGTTVYTEKEGFPTDKLRYISLAGIIKNMAKLGIGLAIGYDEEYIKNKNYDDIYHEYEEKIMTMTNKEIKELFKYSPKVILILDEFNRGNVADLLGDVETVIDRNKRLGEDDALTVKFLRSGNRFAMPPNLYIIATQNYAVYVNAAYLDEGIMVRFAREEKMPNFDDVKDYMKINETELKDTGIYDLISNIMKALIKINKRISDFEGFGRRKTIGHAYLFDIKDPDDGLIQLKNKILPLIKDYCDDNEIKINNILFGSDESTWVSCREGIHGIENIKDMERFIEDINISPDPK